MWLLKLNENISEYVHLLTLDYIQHKYKFEKKNDEFILSVKVKKSHV